MGRFTDMVKKAEGEDYPFEAGQGKGDIAGLDRMAQGINKQIDEAVSQHGEGNWPKDDVEWLVSATRYLITEISKAKEGK